MELALPILLSATTISSPSVLPPAPQLGSDLPDSRFRIDLAFGAPFLPVNPTFIIILHFMSTVAQTDFNEQLQPRTYSAPMYPHVQITTFYWTEARFLLWGIYLAATEMVRFNRFLNVMVKLYWDNSLVGQIDLMVKPVLSLPSSTKNDTRNIIDEGEQLSQTSFSNTTTQASVERLNTPPMQSVTARSDSTDNIPLVNSIKTWNAALSIPSTPPTPLPPNTLPEARITVNFDRVAGANDLTRGDVFLTFYVAILHVAKYPAEHVLRSFNSKTPNINLSVHMYETGIGCLVILFTLFLPPVIDNQCSETVLMLIVGW